MGEKLVTREPLNVSDFGGRYAGYDIEIPAGTPITHNTTCGYDENYNFIDDFSWVPERLPLLLHYVVYYGINVPKDKLRPEGDQRG